MNYSANSPKSNVKLERPSDQSSEGRRTGLGLEDGNQAGGGTDTSTSQETTDTDLTPGVESRDFDGDTDHVESDKGETSSSQTESTSEGTLLRREYGMSDLRR
jgi:hypothetical protein